MVTRIFCFLMIPFWFVSCSKDDDTTTQNNNNRPVSPVIDTGFYIQMEHVVGNLPLQKKTSYYTPTQDTIEINTLIYYFTNIALQKEDSSWYKLPETYYLIDEDKPASKRIGLSVPAGKYIGLRFMLGVDSARNVSGAQEGALDPSNGMFWTWNSGYIQSKWEGKMVSAIDPKAIIYHVGGFSGPYSPLKTVTLHFASVFEHKTTKKSTLTLEANAMKWFYGAHAITPKTTAVVVDPGPSAAMLADNYANMIRLLSAQ